MSKMMVEEMCRCCLHKGKFKSLNSPHEQAFKLKTYAELLKDTFSIEIIPSQLMNTKSYGICDLCMMKLQDAISFKQQIILCEENFQVLLKKEKEDWDEDSNESDPLNHTAFENDEIKIEMDMISGSADENDDSKKYQVEIETSVIKIDKIECKEEPLFEETIEAQCDSDDCEPVKGPTENDVEVSLLVRRKSKRTTVKKKIKNNYTVMCEICGKTVKKSNLIRHVESSHNKDFRCSQCPQSFNLERQLRSHEYRCHNSDIPYTCPVCFIGFEEVSRFLRHKQSHTGDRPYKCNLCSKAFSDKTSRTMHKRHVHNKIKRDKKWCELCKKEVLNMGKHMRRIHSDAKPYVCDYCGKGFTDRGYLILHIRIHTGERPYQCDDCGLRFNQPNVLKTHKAGRNCKKTPKKAGKS